jgi:hypothetical protein
MYIILINKKDGKSNTFAVPLKYILLITGTENKARLRFENLNWERLTDSVDKRYIYTNVCDLKHQFINQILRTTPYILKHTLFASPTSFSDAETRPSEHECAS